MRIAYFLSLLGLLLTSPTFAQPLPEPAPFKGMELYSWHDYANGTWRYSLLIGTNRNKKLEEIQDPEVVIPHVTQLKYRIENLPKNTQVFWFIDSREANLSYPSREVVEDLVKFASDHEVELHVDR